MKILLLSNVFPPGFIGGYEIGALEVARGLTGMGHEVRILTSDYFEDDRGEISDLQVDRILECPMIGHEPPNPVAAYRKGVFLDYANIRRVGSAIHSFGPDLCLLFNVNGLGVMGLVRFLSDCGLPSVLYLMDNVFGGVNRDTPEYGNFERLFGPVDFHRCRAIAMSDNVMRQVGQSLGGALPEHMIVPGWIHADQLSPTTEPPGHSQPVRFVFSSRVAPHKGTELLIGAAERLAARNVPFVVDVYGQGLVAEFIQSVKSKNLEAQVRYCGPLGKDAMVRKFGEYDGLLFPTWEREPFGFVVSEAAAMGCIPIMTASIGASEWFINDVDCMKIVRNPDSLADAMYRLIMMSPQERYQMRLAAMASARLNLRFDHWLPQIEAFCRNTVEQCPKPAVDRSAQVRAAYLFLNQLWTERLA